MLNLLDEDVIPYEKIFTSGGHFYTRNVGRCIWTHYKNDFFEDPTLFVTTAQNSMAVYFYLVFPSEVVWFDRVEH